MNDLRDTIINIEIFAFIGLLIWLYFRPCHLEMSRQGETKNGTSPETASRPVPGERPQSAHDP